MIKKMISLNLLKLNQSLRSLSPSLSLKNRRSQRRKRRKKLKRSKSLLLRMSNRKLKKLLSSTMMTSTTTGMTLKRARVRKARKVAKKHNLNLNPPENPRL